MKNQIFIPIKTGERTIEVVHWSFENRDELFSLIQEKFLTDPTWKENLDNILIPRWNENGEWFDEPFPKF